MKRTHVKNAFLDWFEGKLTGEKKAQVEQHLKSCRDCQVYFQKMAEVWGEADLSIFPQLSPDPFLPARLKALAQEQQNAAGQNQKAFLQWPKTIRLGFSTLALFAAIVIGVLLGKGLSNANTAGDEYSEEDLLSSYYLLFLQQNLADWESVLENQAGGENEN
jgi:predicted anti-sigma-YlaC factor YlaD